MQTAHQDAWIRERAYALWEQEGRPVGREHQHWFQAACEVESRIPVPVMKAAPTKKAAKPAAKSDSAKGRASKSRKAVAA